MAARRIILLLMMCAYTLCDSEEWFSVVDNGLLCINSQYVESLGDIVASVSACAYWCGKNPRCRAFTLADGLCKLFAFDACSQSVRDCGCSKRGRMFVKRLAGLEPGALCPSGYGDDLCGVKYRLYSGTGNWSMNRRICESERGGLTVMADVTDAAELRHVKTLFTKYGSREFFMGGLQPEGSHEPNGGWYWVGCSVTFNVSFWAEAEPNNAENLENVVSVNAAGLNDVASDDPDQFGVLCECLSPFL